MNKRKTKNLYYTIMALILMLFVVTSCGNDPAGNPGESSFETPVSGSENDAATVTESGEDTESDTEKTTETESETEPATETDPVTEKPTETEPATETEPVTEKPTETEPVTEPVTETEPATESSSETEAETEPKEPVDELVFDGDWTIVNGFKDKGDGEYEATNKGRSTLRYEGDLNGANTVEFEFRYHDNTLNDDLAGGAFVGIQVVYKEAENDVNKEFFISRMYLNVGGHYNSSSPFVRTQVHLPKSGGYQFKTDSSRFKRTDGYQKNRWIKMKLVLFDNYAVTYINDKKVLVSEDFGTVTWTTLQILGDGDVIDFRNIKISASEPEENAQLDLEFSEEKSLASLTPKNGTSTYENGTAVYTAKSGNLTLTSMEIEEPAGKPYSMYLPLRNTFLVRMENKTDADRVKLKFRSSTSGDKWFEKEFDILPQSEATTYYFNVSDLGATGYLRQFSMEFVGGSKGTVTVDAITFEREKRIYHYVGSIDSCTADPNAKTVTIVGKVDAKYNGEEIKVYQSDITNFSESLTDNHNELLTTVKAADGKFTVTFPLNKKGTEQTHLSSWFLLSVDNKKVAPFCYIENYWDFNDDPERFKIDVKLEAVVTDPAYGAKGDGFTDDTAAIQKAIDAVAAAGGGRVVIPGDDSEYGKRYILTHIELASNIELCIEENAVLWQSQREAELNKTVPVRKNGYDTVYYGHNVNLQGLVWCTGYSTVNLPMILVRNSENVRITGGGTIRMNDAGGEEENPANMLGNINKALGQAYRVQQIPVCVYSSTHVDITDLTMIRSNGWHCYLSFNNDVYVANMKESETASITGDTITITSCKNVIVDRCFYYTSDDAVGICTAYDDGRAQFYRPTKPEEDNATENIIIRHSYIWGGNGISWMAWGTRASNEHNQEIRNVEIFDCVLGGNNLSSGSWPDDPFYGASAYSSYDQSENDHTPLKDVYYHDNTYLKSFNLAQPTGVRLEIANLIVKGNIQAMRYNPDHFLNPDFDKDVHQGNGFEGEIDKVVGLGHWSERPGDNGTLGTEKIGTKESKTVDTGIAITQDNYAAYIKGNGELFQGMMLGSGAYNFTLDTKLVSGKATIFVRDGITGDIIASQDVAKSSDYVTNTLYFTFSKATVLQIGIQHEGGAEEIVYFDNADVVKTTKK